MPDLVLGSTTSYDGDSAAASTSCDRNLGASYASESSGALTLDNFLKFDNSGSSLIVYRDGDTSLTGAELLIDIIFSESTDIGTATNTYTGPFPDTTSVGDFNDGTIDATYACDISNFSSSDSGTIFETGGLTNGANLAVSGGNLIFQSSASTDISVALPSSINGTTGTLYATVDYLNKWDFYWVTNGGDKDAGTVVTSLGTTNNTGDYAGTNDDGIGGVSGNQYGTSYGNYAGTITEFRYHDAVFHDFSVY
jgi:hypothetical protein